MPHKQDKNKSKRVKAILEPLEQLDLENCKDLNELLCAMSKTSFGGRDVGRAWTVLKDVVADRECALVLTISGAMTVAKLGFTFGSLLSRGIVKSVITTGAIVTHSLVEEIGLTHYRTPQDFSDEELNDLNLNRIYDSIEPEANLEVLEKLTGEVLSTLDPEKHYGSFEIIKHISAKLFMQRESKGLLCSALKHDVNVYTPALTDSELGLYLYRHNRQRVLNKINQLTYDPIADLEEYAQWLRSKKRIAFLTLGGGVPRNWGQQMLPFLRSELSEDQLPKVVAAVRICPDQVSLGHLSGSTYSEGISWGKFDAKSKDNFVEIHCDSTIIFPILAKALVDHVNQSSKLP